MENDGKVTGVQQNDKTTGVDSDKKSKELGSTGETDKEYELALVEEAITEAERYITGGTDLLAVTKTKTEEARNGNMIHPDLQVTTVEHTYNLRRYGFQATIIHCALTQL